MKRNRPTKQLAHSEVTLRFSLSFQEIQSRRLACRKPRDRATPIRSGLILRGHRAEQEVRAAFVRFCRWLRTKYEFPIRVPVYLNSRETILTWNTREEVSATFFAPDDPNEEPLIRIATGDYAKDKQERGRDNALAAQICSLAHELVHYWQWIETDDIQERGVGVRARNIIDDYAMDVDHP